MDFFNVKPASYFADHHVEDDAKNLEPLPVPDVNNEAVQSESSHSTEPKSSNTELPVKQTKRSKPKRQDSDGRSYRVPEVKDSVFIKDLPRSLFKVIDKAIDDPKANQSEKLAAFLFSIIGDEDARDVSQYVKDLSEKYGYDMANEIRDLRESVERITAQAETLTKMINKANLMNDQELYALSFLIHNRLGFSRQPITSESEVNFNDPGVEKIRKKMHRDWKIQHDEQQRKEGIDIYHSKFKQ